MLNSEPLVPFGLGVIFIVGLFIAVPFLRGRSELLTVWNTFLIGVIIYVGLAAIEVKYVPSLPYQQLDWFQPTVKEVKWFMWASSAFIATLLAAYYFNTPAKAIAQKCFRKWPEVTAPLVFFILGCCSAVVIGSLVLRHVTFVGPVLFNLSQVAAPAACVFSFVLWYRNRINIGWLTLFIMVFLGAAMYAMVVSGGRRLLLSIFLGPILYMYWVHVRHWGRAKVILTLAVAAAVVIGVGAVYSKFRYYNLETREARSARGIVGKLHELHTKGDWFSVITKSGIDYFSQSTAHYSLLTERYIGQGSMAPVPLNTLRFIIAYPVPHNIWSRKPEVVGLTMPRDISHLKGNNWGVGIAGHAIYEGGIMAAMLYAVLLAFGIRVLDEPLRLQPQNPFLIYMQAAALPHIIGIPRGDMGTMVINAAQCVLFAVLLGLACRVLFGTKRIPSAPPISSPQAQYGVYRVLPKPRANP
jgi:hypothetical protein